MGTSFVASRARTTAQKIRSSALRKPFELVTIRAASEIPGATVELDWTMPVRQVWVNGEPVVLQPKKCLRGNFVSHRFEFLSLPAWRCWRAAHTVPTHVPLSETSRSFKVSARESQDNVFPTHAFHVGRRPPNTRRRRGPRSLHAIVRRQVHRFIALTVTPGEPGAALSWAQP